LTQGDPHQAGQIKGLLRSWDGIAVPQWGGLKAQQCIQLGYFCLRLNQMANNPDKNIASLSSNTNDTRVFRQFNQSTLESDQNGSSNWNMLCQDLAEIIAKEKPDILLMPHPCFDPHRDHYFSSKAVIQALSDSKHQVNSFFLYANHNQHTDMFPFGKANSLQALPPQFIRQKVRQQIFSLPLNKNQQQHKLLALAMMHDLNVPLSLKKRFRKKLQALLLGREISSYGQDDYLRKAVRQNEVFFIANYHQVQQMLEENYFGY